MANPHHGEAPLVLGERNLTVKIDFNAVAEIGTATGLNLLREPERLGERLVDSLSFDFLRQVLAIGLSRKGHPVTPEQVGAWIDGAGAPIAAVNACVEAFTSAFVNYLRGPVHEEGGQSPNP